MFFYQTSSQRILYAILILILQYQVLPCSSSFTKHFFMIQLRNTPIISHLFSLSTNSTKTSHFSSHFSSQLLSTSAAIKKQFLLLSGISGGSSTTSSTTSSSTSNTRYESDRVGTDVTHIPLSNEQLSLINTIHASELLHTSTLQSQAISSGWDINRHLIFRYLAASNWINIYNGKPIDIAVSDTISWRFSFLNKINLQSIKNVITQGIAYVNGVDKKGRSLLYFKFGKIKGKENPENLLNALMYTVERADLMSVASGSGEFLAIIDFDGVNLYQCPPIQIIKNTIHLLKLHYPYRLGGIYVINTGFAFNMLWKCIKPILPKLALSKTFIISKKDVKKIFVTQLGEEFVEENYGGKRKEIVDLEGYLLTKDIYSV